MFPVRKIEMKKSFLSLLAGVLVFSACSNDSEIAVPDDVTVQDFMWRAMNFWYFWQADVPLLDDNQLNNAESYTDLLESQPDPESFYQSIQFNEDRFSFLRSDYTTLVNNLNGVSKSNGLEFGLVQFSGSSGDLFGYVRYIIPNSDASTQDIVRGELFTGVNGVTLNLSNYRDLLFGLDDTYTLNMADINGTTITPNGKSVTLTKEEGLVENPIFIAQTLDVQGQKIGYLMYNGFTRDFDSELNQVFGQFVNDGVTDLILDLRYNGGGSVNTARLLSSMIYGTNTNDLFLRQRWNDKIQALFSNAQLEDYFASTVDGSTPINTLNLNRVFVIGTNSTASSSELVMNGLDPYIEVIHVGETTRGKNEFSITLVDDPGNSYIYDSDREGNINPDNSYGLQPLVGRNENANGFFDYTAGFSPDILLEEDLSNLGILGQVSEPLLARALQEITGVSTKRNWDVVLPAKVMAESKQATPLFQKSVLDKKMDIPALLNQQ